MIERELTDAEKQSRIDFNETFNSVHGQRALGKLKSRFSYDTVIWKRDTLGRIDPYDVTIRAAQKTVINYIISQMDKKGM